jgi:hypothetical protein
MHAYDLWHPAAVEEDVVEFDVTASTSGVGLNQPSRDWIAQALTDLQVEGVPLTWEVFPVRTNFFSDYVEESNWKDRWQKAWVVRVRCSGVVDPPTLIDWSPVPTKAADRTADQTVEDTGHARPPLVAAVFGGADIESRLRDDLEAAIRQSVGGENGHVTLAVKHAAESWQLRVSVGLQFPECVPLVDSLRNVLKEKGGAISWKHTLGMRRPFRMAPPGADVN